MRFKKVSLDINQTILTVLSIGRVELRKHGVEVQTHLKEHLPTVQGDKVLWQQVVLNLVMNGIEAMDSVRPRVLKIQTDQTKLGLVRVSIEDTGSGIDPSNLDRIFKPLFTTKATGMGMGLSICRSITRATAVGFGRRQPPTEVRSFSLSCQSMLREDRERPLGSDSTKLRVTKTESAYPPKAEIGADILFRCLGPQAEVAARLQTARVKSVAATLEWR